MKYLNFKDLKRRKDFQKSEIDYLRLKSIVYNVRLPLSIRFLYNQKLCISTSSSSLSRLKNRCLVTSNSKSVYRFFKMNRITLREFFSQNRLAGIKKAGW